DPSAGHDRVRPAWAAQVGNREAALFDVRVRVRLGQSDNVTFAQEVEHAVGVSQRAFADAAVRPHPLAGGEFDAGQDGVTVEPVYITVHQDHAAGRVHHLFRDIRLIRLALSALP